MYPPAGKLNTATPTTAITGVYVNLAVMVNLTSF